MASRRTPEGGAALKRGGGVTMVPLDFETAEGEIARTSRGRRRRRRAVLPRVGAALLERSVADLKRHAERPAGPEMFEVFARYDLATKARRGPRTRRSPRR
jgi:hypothetical protein